jgi:hypothetical protein
LSRTLPTLLVVGALAVASAACGTSKPINAEPGGSVTSYVPPTTLLPPTTEGTYTPTPADFQIEIIETGRSCFGSAGCNIKFKINPTYVGTQTPNPKKTYQVIYDVTGGENTKSDNFTYRDGKWDAGLISEDFLSAAEGAVIAANVTRVVEK